MKISRYGSGIGENTKLDLMKFWMKVALFLTTAVASAILIRWGLWSVGSSCKSSSTSCTGRHVSEWLWQQRRRCLARGRRENLISSMKRNHWFVEYHFTIRLIFTICIKPGTMYLWLNRYLIRSFVASTARFTFGIVGDFVV